MFDWEDMRHFTVFAERRSLSAAARQLKVDHATVARRIAALETALGLKLVDRRPRAYVLTAEGQRIAGLGARMETESFAVERAAQAGQGGLEGEVSISAPPAVASAFIAPRLGELRRKHPGIRILLVGEKRYVSLARREADIAIRLSRPVDGDLVARKVGTVPFALYASRELLAARAPEDFTFLSYDDSMHGSTPQDWLLANAGTRPIVMRTNDSAILLAAARAGAGAAVLPTFLGDGDDTLQRLESDQPPLLRDIWMAVHEDLRAVPLVRAVMGFLAGCFA